MTSKRSRHLRAGDYSALALFRDSPAATVADLAALLHGPVRRARERVHQLIRAGLLYRQGASYHVTPSGAAAAWGFADEVAGWLAAA